MGLVKMKGQIFLVTSILIIIALIILRTVTMQTDILPQNNLADNFKSLKNEIIKTVDLSISSDEDVLSNLNNFTNFTLNIYKERGYTQAVSYTVSKIANTTTVNVNISLVFADSYLSDSFIINRTVFS